MRDRFVDSTDTDSLFCKSRIPLHLVDYLSDSIGMTGLSPPQIQTHYRVNSENLFLLHLVWYLSDSIGVTGC